MCCCRWLIRGSSCSFVLSQVAPSRNMEVSGTWDGLVSSVLTTPVFPYLWLPHVIIMTFFLRSSLGPSAVPWAQRHPFSCFTLGLVYCFSGGLVGLFLSNKSLLTILTWSPNLYSFSIAWYLMFFSPFDVVHRLVSSLTPVLPLMVAAQDWLRIAVVASGIRTTLEEHPTAFVYPVVFAVVTSNGFLIFKYFEQVRTEVCLFPNTKNLNFSWFKTPCPPTKPLSSLTTPRRPPSLLLSCSWLKPKVTFL